MRSTSEENEEYGENEENEENERLFFRDELMTMNALQKEVFRWE